MKDDRKHIAVLCTLDTKSEHAACVKALIESRGHRAVLIDIGVLGEPGLLADKTRAELARAAGANIGELALTRDRGAALAIMSTGAESVVMQMYRAGELNGILCRFVRNIWL